MESACAVRPHPATRAFSLPSPHHPPSLPGPGSSLGSACEHGRVREERVVAADGGVGGDTASLGFRRTLHRAPRAGRVFRRR